MDSITQHQQDELAASIGISSQARRARHGSYLGMPSSRERLAELLGRTPTRNEASQYRRLRVALGSDPTLEELLAYCQRRHSAP